MTPTRHYFTKAIAPPPKVKKPSKASITKGHIGKRVIITLPNGQTRIMSSRDAALAMGRSKGGLSTHAKGKRHTWTSESGSKAAKKLWRTRWRYLHSIGGRIGMPTKRAKAVKRAPLRLLYAHHLTNGISYTGTEFGKHIWVEVGADGICRRLQEVTALRKLGHLPTTSGLIPTPATMAPFMYKPRVKKETQ